MEYFPSLWMGEPAPGVSVVFLCAVLGGVVGISCRYRWVPCSSRRLGCVAVVGGMSCVCPRGVWIFSPRSPLTETRFPC